MRPALPWILLLGVLWSCDRGSPAPRPDAADIAGTYWTALGFKFGILLELRRDGCAITGFESCYHGAWRGEGVWWQEGGVIVVRLGDETRPLRLTRTRGAEHDSLVPLFDGPWFRGETRGLGLDGGDTLFTVR